MKKLLEKHFSKKNLRLISIAMGIGASLFYFVVRAISKSLLTYGSVNMLVFVFVVFYIAMAIATAVVLYYSYLIYFKNQDKDVSVVVIFGINCFVAVTLLLNIPTLMFFIRFVSASSMSDYINLANDALNIQFAAGLLDMAIYALIGLAGYNGYLFNKEKGSVAAQPVQPAPTATPTSESTATAAEPTATTPMSEPTPTATTPTSEPVANTTTTNTTTASTATAPVEKKPNETVEKIKGFVATKKGKGIIGGVVAALIIGVVAFNFISNQKTEIDLTKDIKVSFSGYSGEGYASIDSKRIKYDGSNEDVESFLDNVYFTIEGDNGDLSNGDEITVVANYSKEGANRSKVEPINVEKKFKVKGLTAEYAEYDDLSKEEKKNIENAWDEYFDEGTFEKEVREDLEWDFKRDSEIALSDKELLGRYYGESEYHGGDVIVYVVKVTASGTERYSDKEKKETKYYKIELTDITTEKLAKVKKNRFELKYNSEITNVTSDDDAIDEMIDYYEGGYSDYEMTEID